MEPICTMTNLQRNPNAVKEIAKDQVVRITEQGGDRYVFASEEAFEARIKKEREDAAYEARLMDTVGRGAADVREGRFTTSVDEAFARADEMRKAYA